MVSLLIPGGSEIDHNLVLGKVLNWLQVILVSYAEEIDINSEVDKP